MDHVDTATAYRAACNELSEDEELIVDAHVAQCANCLERLRTAYVLHHNLEPLLAAWNASRHGELFRRWMFFQALEKTEVSERSVLEGFIRSVEWIKDRSAIGVSLLLNRGRRLVTQAASLLPEGFSFELQPVFQGVGNERLNAVEAHRLKSSVLLSHGDTEGAIGELELAARIDRRSVEGASGTIHSDREGTIRVYSDASTGRIWVKYWPTASSPAHLYAFLAVPDSPSSSRIAPLEPAEGEEFLYTIFDDVTDMRYELLIIKNQEDAIQGVPL